MADMLTKIKAFIAPPVFADEEQTLRAGLLNIVLWLFVVALVVVNVTVLALTGGDVASGDWAFLPVVSLILLVTIFVLRRVMMRGHPRRAATALLGVMWAILTVWLWFVGGLSGGQVALIYTLLIASAALMVGQVGAIAFTVLGLVGVVGAYAAEQLGVIAPVVEPVDTFDLLIIVIVFMLLGVLLQFAMRIMSRALGEARDSARAQIETNRQLKQVQATLEERVEARTRALARRTYIRQATAEVGRTVMAYREARQLLQAVADAVGEQFACPYVGIFLLDETSRSAATLVLRVVSHTGEGPAPMEPGRLVTIHQTNVVGEAARQRAARIAVRGATSEVDGVESLSAFPPLLEGTAAEIALPLVAAGRLRGVLDMHSAESDRFQPDDVNALQMMADQIVMALENAELMTASRQALEAERSAYRRESREGWARLLRSGLTPGFRYADREIVPVGDVWHAEMTEALTLGARVITNGGGPKPQSGPDSGDDDRAVVAAPIRVRGQTIGVLDLHKRSDGGAWTERELEVLETLTAQLESALENARLYQDTQRRALREQISREVTDRIRSALTVEDAMRRAVEELARVAGASEMVARVGTERDLLASAQEEDRDV
jgi:GAF domain-containing protein